MGTGGAGVVTRRTHAGRVRGEEIGPWVAWEGGWWGESSGEG